MYPTVLTIGGSDSGGGAGIQADIKTFSALGVHGTSVITAITAQNTLGVQSVFGIGPQAVTAQLDSVLSDFQISWAKTGMLYGPETVSLVAERVKKQDLSLVLDPVIEAEAGGSLLKKDALELMKEELIPLAKVVTPNIFEAQALTGIKVTNRESALAAAEEILKMGSKAVVVKGGHLDLIDLLIEGDQTVLLPGERVKGGNHGVGCTYSAAMTAHLARGLPLKDAALQAKSFASKAIGKSQAVGKGVPPVNQLGVLREEADRFRVLAEMERSLEILLKEPKFLQLIPEVGSNLGMSLEGAVGTEDVAAIEGRLVRAGTKVHQSGPIRFGASRHVAKIILTATRYNPEIRSAMNIRFSQRVLYACKDLGLEAASFNRQEEPPDQKTMIWGISKAIEEHGSVPQVIWDRGGWGKEPMVRLLGKDASQVVFLTLKILQDSKL